MTTDNNILYRKGSMVFAKIKGHPYWPAEITEIINNEKTVKYNVTFFGENTTALIKQSDMCQYSEYKHIHGRPKTDNFKNKTFNSALELAVTAAQNMQKKPQINEPLNNRKTIEEKIQTIESMDEIDLETSLNLAAEAGNALALENSTLKEELRHLQEKALRLEGVLAEKEEIIENMEEKTERYRSKIEDLNRQMEDLNAQLNKAMYHSQEAQKIYEDNDLEQSRIINSHMTNIAKLEKTISALELKLEMQLETDNKDEVPISDTASQTTQSTSNKNVMTLSILDFTNVLNRQERMELEINNVKEQMEQYIKIQETLTQNANEREVKCPSRNARKIQVNTTLNTSYTRIKRKNNFSVSLQVAKSKNAMVPPPIEKTKLKDNQSTEPLNTSIHCHVIPKFQNHNESLQQTTKVIGNKKPPILAKIRPKEESYEEFFQKHINFYKERIMESNRNIELYNKNINSENTTAAGPLDMTQQHSTHQTYESPRLQSRLSPIDTEIEQVINPSSTSKPFLETSQTQNAPI